MSIKVTNWNDGRDAMRQRILNDVLDIMFKYFRNDYLYTNDVQVMDINNVNCSYAHGCPCAHYDGSRVCLTTKGARWCQFVFQVSHELCHCSTSHKQFPLKVRWFDEFICCCSSYLIETVIASDATCKYDYMYDDARAVFAEYLNDEIDGDIYRVNDIRAFFAENRAKYERDENLIKFHDVYVIEYFKRLNGDFSGLSFVNKIHLVETYDGMVIEQFLRQLFNLCDWNEQYAIELLCNMFGIYLR